jgi:hypothetical protein
VIPVLINNCGGGIDAIVTDNQYLVDNRIAGPFGCKSRR